LTHINFSEPLGSSVSESVPGDLNMYQADVDTRSGVGGAACLLPAVLARDTLELADPVVYKHLSVS
jgi:hypothetical protein